MICEPLPSSGIKCVMEKKFKHYVAQISWSGFCWVEADYRSQTVCIRLSRVSAVFYPVNGEPGDVCVCGTQGSSHDRIVVHQFVAQISLRAGVDAGPRHVRSEQLETLSGQDRDGIINNMSADWWLLSQMKALTQRSCSYLPVLL